ncbi:MAG TPA: hypothetical protein VKZ86_01390 [Cyclobacteriaceae bacterium]|nr:hypothetical protein [Cyclobacteriaceae bacterium]
MKNIPDDLFRRKLEHLQTPPPPRAWEKIEKGMRRKRITPWLAIAASLLLVITAATLILTRQPKPDAHEIADRQLPETNAIPDTSYSNADEPLAESSADTSVTPQTQPQSPPVVSDAPPSEAVATNNAQDIPDKVTGDEEQEDIAIASLPTLDSIPAETAIASGEDNTAPVKIVLEAEEVQARYLKKKKTEDATEEVATASGIRKLLDKADQIQNPIGDLRQMKNEIFALNFPGNKRDQRK